MSGDLAVLILQHVGESALQDAGRPPPLKRAACSPSAVPRPPASTPMSRTSVVAEELVEGADGV